MSHMRQVTFFFQHEDNSRATPLSDTNTNNNGGRREMGLCQLKMRILRFLVNTVLATKYSQASKTQRHI